MKHQENEKVTPEMAAKIVKEYVLPMFESDQKKILKGRHNKLQNISAQLGRKFRNQKEKCAL